MNPQSLCFLKLKVFQAAFLKAGILFFQKLSPIVSHAKSFLSSVPTLMHE